MDVLIHLDDDLARRLERVAPARDRQRSRFIREAILKALWDLEEKNTESAYRRSPQESGFFEARAWEPAVRRKTRKR